jgi:Acetyl-CoA hydrolase/transferase C-terminal domain
MEPRLLRPGDLPAVLPPDGLTLVSSCSAHSDLLAGEVAAAGAALGAINCSGVFVPGLNRATWQAGPASRVTTFFLTEELKRERQRTRFLPLCYEDIVRFYRRERPQAALFMCSPPDANGQCSFGSEVAFIAALWREIPVRIAHINPLMPRTPGDPGIPFAALSGWYEGEQPLLATPVATPDAASLAIANYVASLVPDGATLQTGLGKIPDAVLAALSSHRGLRMHSGLVGDGALALIAGKALAEGPSALVGVAIGSASLYASLDHEHFQFRPVTMTHSAEVLAAIDTLVTINSAMEVDLFGQVFAESSARGFQSGPGGASDYARAGRRSAGGLRIIALPATAKGASRLVAPGRGHGPVSLSRFDVDCVVTENGIADLRGKSWAQRALALITVAAPDHRDALTMAWREIARDLPED